AAQLVLEVGRFDGQARGQALDHDHEGLTVGLAGGEVAQHRSRGYRPAASAPESYLLCGSFVATPPGSDSRPRRACAPLRHRTRSPSAVRGAQAFLGSSLNGSVLSLFGSLGRPSTRSPMMLRW